MVAAVSRRRPPPYWRELGALSREAAAEVLGISMPLLDRMRRAGEIDSRRVGARVVIPTREILRLLGEPEPGAPGRVPARAPLRRDLQKIVDEATARTKPEDLETPGSADVPA